MSYLKLSPQGLRFVQSMLKERVPTETAVRERQCQVSFLKFQRMFLNFHITV